MCDSVHSVSTWSYESAPVVALCYPEPQTRSRRAAGAGSRRRRLNPQSLRSEGDNAFAAGSPRNEHRSDGRQQTAWADLELVDGPGAAGLNVEELSPGR